jgi:5-methylcytosine-specific restriction endonuclease McrA
MSTKRSTSRRSAKAGNHGQGSKWIRREKRLRIYARDGWRCVWCQCSVIDGRERAERLAANPLDAVARCIALATLDHFLPRTCGGTNDAGNLVTSCVACNEKRGEKPAIVWATELAEGLARFASVEDHRADILVRVLRSLAAPLLTLEERSAA